MREFIYFLGSLAGAAVLTALAVLVEPKSTIWSVIFWIGTIVFVMCAIALLIDIVWKTFHRKAISTTSMKGSEKISTVDETLITNARSAEQKNNKVFSAQFRELQRVTDLFGGKDEHALMQMFDYEGFVKFNLIRAKQIIDPNRVTPEESVAMEQFFAGGAAIFDIRYVHISPFSGGQRMDPIPGVAGILRTSKKYEDAKRLLLPFESSPQMPTAVQESIKDFDQALANNTSLIIEVVNQKTSENANNLFSANDLNSPYYGVIWNAYWNCFTPLKPKADVVLKNIRAFLKVS